MSPQGYQILILGGGVAGLTTALALTKFGSTSLCPTITIFEIRSEPGTVGGAINLTPNALRLLDYLGVLAIVKQRRYGITVNAVEVFSIYHPSKLAESSFRGPKNEGIGNPPYKAIRITRANLMEALVEAINKTPNITMKCNKRAKGIEEDDSGVTIFFADGTSSCGDLLIGCDGVHSFTRNYHVDPKRNQVYTGLANAFGFVPLAEDQPVHFEVSALNFARRGMLLTSYYEHTKRSGYVGAIIEVPDVGSIDGWKAQGGAQESVRNNITERFREAVLPAIHTFIHDAKDWFIWPIYSLPPLGKWATDKTILLGDAAHAMPPQGESTGIVLEDGILLARCLLRKQAMQGSIKEAFDAYEKLRRTRINSAYKESQGVVNSVKDTGTFGHALKTFIIPIYLLYSRAEREKHFVEDVTIAPLGFGDIPIKVPPPSASVSSLFEWLK